MTAPLILAIEPDRHQASQLTAIANGLSVEFVLAESGTRALEVLNKRLPDLILTPALLSRRDDVALTERLRELGEAGAHIQTLTIPMLDASEPPSRGSGMLSALRRAKARIAGPDGCDAEAFADQIAVYLQRAAAARSGRTESHTLVVGESLIVQPYGETAVFVEQELPIVSGAAGSVEERAVGVYQAEPSDEWGFFDPEQPRFAALLAKLDEIAAEAGTT